MSGHQMESIWGQVYMPGQEGTVPSQASWKASEAICRPGRCLPLFYMSMCAVWCAPGVYGLPTPSSRVYEAIGVAGRILEAWQCSYQMA